MPASQPDQLRLCRELAHLATFTHADPSSEGTAVTRVVFTPDDLAARAWLRGLAEAEGLATRIDPAGNTFFRWQGTDAELPAVATGSHIDAIPHAGMYDGTVGVLGGLEAIRALKSSGFRPRRSIELVLLTSEEPTRFGIGCLGSRLLGGTLDAERADALPDLLAAPDAPANLARVREQAGFAGDLAAVRLPEGHYAAWVELHIEQGPLLERAGLPIGIVTGIAAPAGYRFTLEGLGGHAGALLMPDRRDALCAAAELILAVERRTRAANAASGTPDTVATIGTCDVHPGAVNSVPSRVTLQLDIRDTDPGRRESVMQSLREDIARIGRDREVRITEQQVNADPPATSSPAILTAIEQACATLRLPAQTMVSRAYHDSLFMARICPIAMIFIPSRAGVSHRPDEYSTPEHIAQGVHVLALTLAKLALA
jgi:N-carbamoyl-L-amino-acid hydrolase